MHYFPQLHQSVHTLFISVVLFLLASVTLCTAQVLDRVVAIVNDEIITLSELEQQGEDYFERIRKSASTGEAELDMAKEKVLSNLINEKLIYQEAKKAGIKLSDKEFIRSWDNNLKKMNLTREELSAKLEASGINEQRYQENYRRQLLRDKLVAYEVRSKIVITEEMINEYYNNEYTSEIAEGGYYILQMGFTAESDDSSRKRALQRAENARNEVLQGANFTDIARQKSELPSAEDGGDLGVFQEDEMADYMKKAILPLNVGDVSSIIETPNGYQFFKLLSTQKGDIVQQVPYESVKENIRKQLFEKRFADEYRSWVQDIKEGAYIKIML